MLVTIFGKVVLLFACGIILAALVLGPWVILFVAIKEIFDGNEIEGELIIAGIFSVVICFVEMLAFIDWYFVL